MNTTINTMTVLKPDIIELIKTDPLLYGQVADALNVVPMSLPRLLYSNNQKLTQASVMQVLRNYLKKQDKDLLEEKVVD